jgi:hypothetical protein
LCWAAAAFLVGAWRSEHPLQSGAIVSLATITALALTPQFLFKPQRRVLRVGPDGLRTTIGTKSGEFSWRDIARVERDGAYVVVTNRNLNAFIIPVAAFPTAASCESALAEWQVWLHAASAPAVSYEA